jgi:hypothetical protein
MSADEVGDGVDPGFLAEIEDKAAGSLQRGRIELKPARLAASRKPAIGDNNVGVGAGANEWLPVDAISGAGREKPPVRLALVDDGDARIVRAIAEWRRAELSRLPVEAGRFGQ